MTAAKIRALHEFFVQVWLKGWLEYYKEAQHNAEANCKYMRNIKVKSELVILELEVSEHSLLAYQLICDFLETRAALMLEDLRKSSSLKRKQAEYRFFLSQLTQFSFAATQFANQKMHEHQRSIIAGAETREQFADMPELDLLFRHQIAAANANIDTYRGFIENICKLMEDILRLLK